MGKVSQKMIAAQLGLSQRAVSMALRGEVGVSVETRRKVQTAARQMGYRSNRLARSLINGETRIIGALSPGLGGLFLSELFDAANKALADRGYTLMISRWQDRHQRDDEEINVLLQYCVEGIIAVPRATGPWEQTIYAELARRRENVIFVNQKFPGYGVCSVYSDDAGGSRAAIEFLLRQGHRHVACVEAGGPFATSYILRRQGYKEALANAGIELRADYVCDSDTADLGEWLPATMTRHPEISAVFCFNDSLAIEVITALDRGGRRVPDDVAVIGYGNDLLFPEQMRIPLTTVNQCSETMGRRAAEQMLHMIDGEPIEPDIVVPTRLIVRQSAPGSVTDA